MAALNELFSRSVLMSGIVPEKVQHFAFGIVQPHLVHVGPRLKLVQVLLDGILSFCCINCLAEVEVDDISCSSLVPILAPGKLFM